MIFQSLIQYYDRMFRENQVPPFGYSIEGIGFSIILNKDGMMLGEPRDLRKKIKANKYEYFLSSVPYTNAVNVRSSGAANTPNFMVDKADYVFGMSGNTKKPKHHKSFAALICEVCGDSEDPGVIAVKKFIEQWNPEDSVNLSLWKEISGPHGKWIAFELGGETGFIHERPEVKRLWERYLDKLEYKKGVSFVSDTLDKIQEQYAQFKFGSGASLVSFNENAYESYGKKRGENAPIHVDEEFKSSTALKHLFRSRSQRVKIGDATTVFWTERTSPIETFMGMILNPQDDTADNIQLKSFLDAARKGIKPDDPDYDGKVRFYILGLSLNKARFALRFWYESTVDELKDKLGDHFNNLEMDKGTEKAPEYPGIWHLLKETARETKDIPPLLGGALMRSILEGTNYPENLYSAVLHRIRADQAKKYQNVTYLRAAIIKAVLTRNYQKEVPMSLDPEKRDVAYLLGRLFAVLEKAQQDALGSQINATIKDRFFGAASTTPASVFPLLLRLSQHHIGKADYGYISDQRIAEIMEHIDVFPSHMNLQQQGMFAIGYYQQKNALWQKKNIEKGEKDD